MQEKVVFERSCCSLLVFMYVEISVWSKLTLNPAGSQGLPGPRCTECPCTHPCVGVAADGQGATWPSLCPRSDVQLVHIKELCANIWVCHSLPALNVFWYTSNKLHCRMGEVFKEGRLLTLNNSILGHLMAFLGWGSVYAVALSHEEESPINTIEV